MELVIKPAFQNTVIAFQDSGIALKERSQLQLIDLALLAHSSGDTMIQGFFEYLPTVAELQRKKMQLMEQ